MTRDKNFRQMIFAGKFYITSLTAALLVSACATTTQLPPPPTSQQQAPVAQRPEPVQPEVKTAEVTEVAEVKAPEVAEVIKAPEVRAPEPVIVRDGLTPPHMRGRDIKRLALLLPFSAKSSRLREEADSMLKSAEMAVFARNEADVLLMALDTGGTESGARSATQAALKSGVDVILGPILANSVKAASRAARRSQTPVIAFSTDQTAAGNGTYLLSFPPEAEVKRIVDFVATSGATRFAYLGPESAYGKRVQEAYTQDVARLGGEITASETYRGDDISVMQGPARNLANFFQEHEDAKQGQDRMAFEAVILPEGGTPLRSLAPLLPYYDIDPSEVQFLGTGLWHREETVREPALNRGIFAGPDQDARRVFLQNYDQKFGEDPSRLASLAYDAVNVGAFVANGNPAGRHARTQSPNGFYGVDGLVSFSGAGTPNRGLAVYQIQNGKFVVIDPAPRSALGPT